MGKRIHRNVQNFYFLLLTFVTGLFYFSFYVVSLTLGFSMSFTLMGVPILRYVMLTTRTFTQYERTQTKIYTDISMDPYVWKTATDGTLWVQAKGELSEWRNWVAMYWLMQKLLIGIICLLSAFFFYILPFLFILTPILIQWMDMKIFFISIDTLAKSMIIMALGGIMVIVGSWLGRRMAMIAGRYTGLMFRGLK